MPPAPEDDFLQHAQGPRVGLVRELWQLLREHKRWWLAPIVLMVLLLGALSLLGGSAVAPFIYTLF